MFFFCCCAAFKHNPSVNAALEIIVPSRRRELIRVQSTSSCALFQRGKLLAIASSLRPSVPATPSKLRSLSKQFSSTRAPASLQTRAHACSSGFTRCASLPTVGHAALWSPLLSKTPPHLHLRSFKSSSKRRRRSSTSLRCAGCQVRAASTGKALKCAPEARPACERRNALEE